MINLRVILGCLFSGLLASGWVQAQPVYFNTSSAIQSQNTLASVAANGGGNTTLFTANAAVFRCISMAVDALNGKLFLVDGGANAIWSVNLDGTGLTLVKARLASFPTDLALDVLNQTIYLTTSSTIQGDNTVERFDYAGNSRALLFTATGDTGNGVSRCTAIALDLLHSKMFLADAGAQKIWSLDLAGNSLTALATTTNAFPTGLALDTTNQQVYFTASSTVQSSNLIHRVNYDGFGLITRFTASGGVQRCTALDLDVPNATIYLSDAGANTLWRIPLGGGTATTVLSGLTATAKKVRWFNGPTTRPPPGVTGLQLSGADLVLTGTNGFVGGTYYLLTSTKVNLPVNQWLPVSTNVLAASGDFTINATNVVGGTSPQQFFILRVE